MRACAIIVGFDYWYTNFNIRDSEFTHRFVHHFRDANPDIKLLVIDNFSDRPYQSDTIEIVRTSKRVSYAEALNIGLKRMQPGNYDWYITLNNDCDTIKDGNVTRVLEKLNPDILYGSGKNHDQRMKIIWQWSAWLCISKKILNVIGYFDENCAAAFEDFDYQRRAMLAGFKLDTALLPIVHLDKHTRMEDKTYNKRWDAARCYFSTKHGLETTPWLKSD